MAENLQCASIPAADAAAATSAAAVDQAYDPRRVSLVLSVFFSAGCRHWK